ncbi:MAG TPA: hypothetical protein DD422_02680, partial [Akkermansia sp.]|nr:hypothetical protein [Akkermansia sp.]
MAGLDSPIERKEAWIDVKTEATEKKKISFGGGKRRLRRAVCLILTGIMGASSVLPAFAAEQKRVLACGYVRHSHGAECHDEDGKLICGYGDFVVHQHDENCFDEEGKLVCALPEITEHRHDSGCYESRKVLICKETESDGHVHSDECNSLVQGELICENTEADHQHTDDCYSRETIQSCGKQEGEGRHHHGEECYETRDVLVCGKEEVILHTHSDDCYTPVLDENGNVAGRKLTCGMLQVEEHQHGEDSRKAAEELPEQTTQPTTEETAEAGGLEAVAALIAALPETEEILGTLDNLEEEEYGARLEAITAQVREAYTSYMALPEEEREAVENREKLLALADALLFTETILEEATEEVATPTGGFPGYVQALSISNVTDGTAVFDEAEGDGKDTGENNRIVRTYDTVRYNLTATMASRDQNSVVREASLCFDMEMEKDITEAQFEVDAMTWLKTISGWQIEYFRGEELVLVRKPDGILYADNNGDGAFTDPTSVNALAYGSEKGKEAYRLREGDITRQRLAGVLPLTNANNVLAATQSLDAVIRVLNDQNGATLSPGFRVYFEKNPENYGAYSGEGEQMTSDPVSANRISLDSYAERAYQVAITCAPLYNVKLRNAPESVSYMSWFN